jgi:hypothetical protein
MSNDDIEPRDDEELLAKRVSDRLTTETGTYADWVADQVDGTLSEVIRIVVEEATGESI